MGKHTKEGESPVVEISEILADTLSRTEHVEFCLNLGGPPSKAKYSLLTDSELAEVEKGSM